VSDGFAERNEEGAELQRKFVDVAKKAGMRIIGPNTAGLANNVTGKFALCPYECGYEKIKKGTISFITQTGIIALQAVPWADFPYGINKFIDLGNKCDVDESELLEYLGNDPETKVISLYLEGIKDGQRFLKTAKEITRRKPVLVLKSGRTKEAAKAIVSHTGSLAGDDQVFDSACQQANIIRVSKWNELFDFAKILAYQPLPKGNRLGILSCTGATATMLIDTAAEWGLTPAKFSAESSERLRKLFPPAWGANPIDWGIPVAYMPDKGSYFYQQALELLLNDNNVDCIANVIWVAPLGSSIGEYTKFAEELKGNLTKPIATWIYGPSSSNVMELSYHLESMGFPVYHDHETAAKALGIMFRYSTIKDNSL
jgi:acyl-CoA synthetase (NDP forming)